MLRIPEVHTEDGVVVWTAGSRRATVDVWFHPALGDSHLTFRHAFTSELLARARLLAYDPPEFYSTIAKDVAAVAQRARD